MDIGKALTFITEDEEWMRKVGIGTGLVFFSTIFSSILIGLIGFCILMGYCTRLLQNVRDGAERPLPEWDQWGEDFTRGFKFIVTLLIWASPILVFVIPMGLGAFLLDSRNTEIMGGMILACTGCFMFLYGLFLSLMTPGIVIRFAQDEQIASGLQVTEIWKWTQQNLGQAIIAGLLIIASKFVITIAAFVTGLLLCGIGLVVTIPLGILVYSLFQYHLFGQMAREFPMHSGMKQDVGMQSV